MIKKLALGIVSLGLLASAAMATNYPGNGDTGFGGAVGTGSLDVTDNGTNITFTLNRGAGSFNDALVIYLDTAAGGFADTSGFADNADGGRSAVSGFDGTNRSLMTFAGGFAPESAIVIENGFASLFTLANGGANSLTFVTGAAQSGVNNSATYGLTMSLAQLGVTPGSSFELFGTYISTTAFRSTEAIAGNDTGTQGSNPFTQTSFGTYTTSSAVPEPGTILSFLSGSSLLGGLMFIRRRRA